MSITINRNDDESFEISFRKGSNDDDCGDTNIDLSDQEKQEQDERELLRIRHNQDHPTTNEKETIRIDRKDNEDDNDNDNDELLHVHVLQHTTTTATPFSAPTTQTLPELQLQQSTITNTQQLPEQQQQQQQQPGEKQQELPLSLFPLWLLCDKYKAEAMLRIAFCVAVGSTLSVVGSYNDSYNNYIPHHSRYFIGFFASFLPIYYPKLVYGWFGMMPYDSTMMVCCCGIATFLFVICENFGPTTMTMVYSAYVLLMTTLFWGHTYQKTSGLVGFYIGISSMITILFLPQLDYAENPKRTNETAAAAAAAAAGGSNSHFSSSSLLTAAEMWTNAGIENPDAIFRNFLVGWCYAWLCVFLMILLPFPRTARSLLTHTILPRVLREIVEYLKADSSNTRSDGTSPATTNTSTTTKSKDNRQHQQMIHWAYELRGRNGHHNKYAGLTKYEPRIWKNENVVAPLVTLMSDITTVVRVSLFRRHATEIPSLGLLHEDPTFFARNTKHYPSVLELCAKALVSSTTTCTRSGGCRGTNNSNTNTNTNNDLEILRNLPSTIESYTIAIMTRRRERTATITPTNNTENKINPYTNNNNDDNNDDHDNDNDNNDKINDLNDTDNNNDLNIVFDHDTLNSYGTRFYLEKTERVKQSTIMWLDCLYSSNNDSKEETKKMSPKERVKNRMEFNVKWIVEPLLSILGRLSTVLCLLSQPSRWKRHSIGWALKHALGYIFLFALEIYVPNWTTLGVDLHTGQTSFTQSTHHGWQLLAYSMAWRPTVEGTVKKGVMRVAGTCLGGFSGWLGVIVCSWSFRDEHNSIDDIDIDIDIDTDTDTHSITTNMNPYATVVWNTFFTTIAAYLCTDSGPQALFGSSYSHGYLGFYFAMVQSLVLLETYNAPGTRNVVTVERVVATMGGVIVAIILQLIPPNVYGRYPRDIKPCLEEIKIAFTDTIDAALSLHDANNDEAPMQDVNNDNNSNDNTKSTDNMVPSSSSLYEELIISGHQREQIVKVHQALNDRLFLAKDAGTLSFFPLMQLNPKIIPFLEDVTITLDYITQLERIVSGLKENPDRHCLVEELRDVMKSEEATMPVRNISSQRFTINTATTTIAGRMKELNNTELMNVLDGTSLLPGVTKLIEHRILDHEHVLESLL